MERIRIACRPEGIAGRAGGGLHLAGLIAIVTLVLYPSPAQAVQAGGPPPLDVNATPSKTMAGGQVTLSGSAVPLGNDSPVTLRVSPPGNGAPETLQATVDPTGHYALTYSLAQDASPGTYMVEVTAPDEKTKVSTTVIVVAPGVIPAETTATLRTFVESLNESVQAIRKELLAQAPPSAGLQDAHARLAEVEEKAGELLSMIPAIRSRMTQVFQARSEVAEDNPPWDTYVEEMERWTADATARTDELLATIKGISGGTERCGSLDRIVEGLTFASEAWNYANVPLDRSVGYWIDKVPGGFVARQEAWAGYKPATKYLAISTMKVAASFIKEGPAGVAQAVPGLVADAAQTVLQEVMGAECERIEGPIAATFLGESFTTQGEPFLDYTTTLEGKIVFLYEKGAPADEPIGMTGYIEGNGRFEVRDNPEPVIRLTPGQVLFHKVISPPGTGYWDEVGQLSRALLPHSFRIPLKAVLAGDSIVFAFQPAAHDFSDVIRGRSIYVVMPMGGLVPQIIDSPIPLQKAFPILDRVVRRHPVLTVARGAKETVAQGTFARDTANAGHTARVRTKLTIKACSPGCVPLPLTPASKKPGGS